eukprot:4695961-Prymnesium_polylepis.1
MVRRSVRFRGGHPGTPPAAATLNACDPIAGLFVELYSIRTRSITEVVSSQIAHTLHRARSVYDQYKPSKKHEEDETDQGARTIGRGESAQSTINARPLNRHPNATCQKAAAQRC